MLRGEAIGAADGASPKRVEKQQEQRQATSAGEGTTSVATDAAIVDVSDGCLDCADDSLAALMMEVSLSYKGKSQAASVKSTANVATLFDEARRLLELPLDAYEIKLILKGKAVQQAEDATVADALGGKPGAAATKLMVMATAKEAVADVRTAGSDAKVKSFAAEHGSKKGGIPQSRACGRSRCER